MDLSEVKELKEAWDDLAYLHQNGALVGVAEVIRERRRQIEIGWTPESDNLITMGGLARMARLRLERVVTTREQGTADVGRDEDGLRKAGALAAAEIDRLNRMLTGEL